MIFLLTGPVHSGKTILLRNVVQELKKQESQIDGFLSEAVLENNKIIGYDLFDLKEEKSIPFIRKDGKDEWQRIGVYFFIPQSLAEAEKIILRGKNADILVVDELGPLELSGKGLWPALKQIIYNNLKNCLLVIRSNILENFLEKFGTIEVRVFDVRDEEIFSYMVKELNKALLTR